MIGPVHEKDTIAKVNAMKKIPIIPPVLLANLSVAVAQLDGNRISKAPKKEIANITNRTKKSRFKKALLAILFITSAPNNLVTTTPSET